MSLPFIPSFNIEMTDIMTSIVDVKAILQSIQEQPEIFAHLMQHGFSYGNGTVTTINNCTYSLVGYSGNKALLINNTLPSLLMMVTIKEFQRGVDRSDDNIQSGRLMGQILTVLLYGLPGE